MSSPYNPPPGGQQPGEQPQWGGQPGGANYPQQEQPGYPGQGYQQGGYQQGGYQQGNYPQQQGGYGYQQGAQQPWGGSGYGSPDRQSVGIIGLAGAAVGAIVLILGMTALNWYKLEGQNGKFSNLNKDLKDAGSAAPGLAKMYFGWLAWVLVALVVIAAVLASLPIGPAGMAMRIVAPVIGVVGLAVTLLALNNYWSKAKDANPDLDLGLFKHSQIGLYLVLVGFVVAGVAGVFGPRRA